MKAIILLSKTFFPQHPKAGEKTFFDLKVRNGVDDELLVIPQPHPFSKIHTCRSNYEYWKKKIDKLKAKGGVLSVRQWSANPYRSPQETIVTFSGGKDSLAALLWIRNNFTKKFTTVFCDTGWEHPITYRYIDLVAEKLGLELVILKSKKFDGMIDLAKKKSRFPSSQRRFCTSELKSIPMIDYLLDVVKDDFIIIQGIRGAESESRAKMAVQCNYFKYYIEKRINKNGKEVWDTYRRKEVLNYCKNYATDILRPVFDWSAQQVIDYILDNGLEPNPLYKMGFKRVGCFPCIMSANPEIYQITTRFPERITEIAMYEKEIKSSFFGPDSMPKKYYKGDYPLITDVARYVQAEYVRGTLFDQVECTTPLSCMSYYSGLCE